METWETICAFLETLPGTQQDPPGEREVVRVHRKVIAFPATNERSRPAESDADEEFVVIKVDTAQLHELLLEAWKMVAPRRGVRGWEER